METTTQNLPIYRRLLGAAGIQVSALGVGVWAWGDRGYWGYGKDYSVQEIKEAYRASLDNGLDFFDSAEIYGGGRSERLLGRCLHWDPRPAVIASKFAPLPYRLTSRSLRHALEGTLKRLEVDHIDLYQVHWPYTLLRIDALMDQMAQAVEKGQIRAVGVSNYSAVQMERAQRRLAQHGIPLASNQVHYSLLHRTPETNGVLDACRRLNVALIAYSPLEQGILTGKYNADQPKNMRKSRRTKKLSRAAAEPNAANMVKALQRIAERRECTPGQVALNWLLCQDSLVIPIPGAKTGSQVRQNAGALGWNLDASELAAIDQSEISSAAQA